MMNKIFFLAHFVALSSFDLAFGSVNENTAVRERSLLSEDLKLQRLWHEWNYCTNALPSDVVTPMTEVVPKGVFFLTTFRDCQKLFHSRTLTIPKGKQTIFFPLFFGLKAGYSNDWLLGKCESTTSEEAEQVRNMQAISEINTFTSADFTSKLYLKVDGVDVAPIFLRDTGSCVYHLMGCRDGRTIQQYQTLAGLGGDDCDAVAFASLNDLDAHPMYGWWGKDKRKWKIGESHTFEFGVPESVSVGGSLPGCYTAKYVITAQ